VTPPDRWLVLTVESPSEEITPILAEGLVASGGTAVEEHGAALRTYIAHAGADVEGFIQRVEATLGRLVAAPVAVRWEWRDDEDWTERWKRGIEARRVGERLIVTPSWIQPDRRAGDIVLVVDPEMAFGTGEHATTRAALRLLERTVTAGAVVLDVGTGSGILGIAAARLGAAHVDAAECDPEALPYAAANAERNGVGDRIHLALALVDRRYLADRRGRYDLILANVLSGVLRPLLPDLAAALRKSGALVLGGILNDESDVMRSAAADVGLAVVAEDREDEWWTALMRPRATPQPTE
jgi:ribosomal protein L11 methyltransferase